MLIVNACRLQDWIRKWQDRPALNWLHVDASVERKEEGGRQEGRNLLVTLACWHPCDWAPGFPAWHSDQEPWVVPKPRAHSTECFRISRWMRSPRVCISQRNELISLYFGYTNPAKLVNRLVLVKRKGCEQGRSVQGPFRMRLQTWGSRVPGTHPRGWVCGRQSTFTYSDGSWKLNGNSCFPGCNKRMPSPKKENRFCFN